MNTAGSWADDAPDRIRQILGSGKRFLITCHRNPDGDAIGSSLAVRHLLAAWKKKGLVWVPEGVPECYRFLAGAGEVIQELGKMDLFDATVVVDTADPDILAQPLPPKLRSGPVIIIDHHKSRKEWGDVYFYQEAAAVGEMIFDLARLFSLPLSKEIAECIYVAIMTDTGSFRYEMTTPKVMRIAAECIEVGVNPWDVAYNIYENYPAARVRLLVEVLSTLRLDLNGKLATMTASHRLLEKYNLGPDALEEFVNYARGIRGVEVAALIRKRKDGSVRVSLRSRGRIDVSKVAEGFGGGGHHNAAGCTFSPPDTVASARTKLKRFFKEKFFPSP